MDTSKQFSESLGELLKEKDFRQILSISLKTIMPSKRRISFILLILTFLAYPIHIAVKSPNTTTIFIELIEISDDVIKCLFGITFTGYALFQALVGANSIKQMLLSKIGEHNAFKTFNLYFFILNISYLSFIIANYIILITLSVFNISILSSLLSNGIVNVLKYVAICIYIYLNLLVITEIKSFIVNLYHCFNMSVVAEGIELLNQSNDETSEYDIIEELAKLKSKGILTEEEFKNKKKELLDRL